MYWRSWFLVVSMPALSGYDIIPHVHKILVWDLDKNGHSYDAITIQMSLPGESGGMFTNSVRRW